MNDVVFFINEYPPTTSNRARRMDERVAFLALKGVNVIVYCPKVLNSRVFIDLPPNVVINKVGFKISIGYNHRSSFIRFLSRVFKGYFLWSIIACFHFLYTYKSSKITIYTVNHPVALHLIGFIIKKIRGNKWIAEQRDPLIGYKFSKNIWLHNSLSIFVNYLLVSADTVFGRESVINEASKKINIKKSPEYGVDLKDFPIINGKNKLLQNNQIKAIYAGGLYDFKRYVVEIDLLFRKKKICLHYYGNDRFNNYKNFVNCGCVDYSTLVKLYRTYNFVVALDHIEVSIGNFIPSKVCELIASQLPVLVLRENNNIGALTKIVEENKLGLSLNLNSDKSLDRLDDFLSVYIDSDNFNYKYYFEKSKEISIDNDLEFFYELF